jgi:nucleoside-diphosphate-sugar epimerase
MVAGFLKAAETPSIEGETFNLGFGQEVRISELAEMILAQIGRPVRIEVEPQRFRPEKSEVQRLLADNRLAHKRLGWEPSVSLPDGLQQTIAWIRQHLDLYRPDVYIV